MDKQWFCDEYLSRFTENRDLYEEHIDSFPEILCHIFAARAVNEKMLTVFIDNDDESFACFCHFIEHIWSIVHGDENNEVLNIIDVIILEGISDNEDLWQAFGRIIGDEMKGYINNTVLKENIMMSEVAALR